MLTLKLEDFAHDYQDTDPYGYDNAHIHDLHIIFPQLKQYQKNDIRKALYDNKVFIICYYRHRENMDDLKQLLPINPMTTYHLIFRQCFYNNIKHHLLIFKCFLKRISMHSCRIFILPELNHRLIMESGNPDICRKIRNFKMAIKYHASSKIQKAWRRYLHHKYLKFKVTALIRVKTHHLLYL